MLWEKSFCYKSPIALAYTRGHFSSLVSMEMVKEDLIGAGANVDNTEDESVTYLPVVDYEGKLLPLPFLKQSEVGKILKQAKIDLSEVARLLKVTKNI